MNLKDLMKYGQSYDELTWNYVPQVGLGRRNDDGYNLLAYSFANVDPFSHRVSGLISDNYGGYNLAYRLSMDVNYDKDHFWFRAVYQIIKTHHVGYAQLNNMGEWRRQYYSYIRSQMNEDSLGWGMLQSIHGSRTGFVFVTLEGGGPLDGSEIDVDTVRNIQQLTNDNYNQNLFTRGVHSSCMSKAISCYIDPPNNLQRVGDAPFTGRISIEPSGAMGVLEARVTSSATRKKRNIPTEKFDNPSLLESIKRTTSQNYKPYSGWIPSDTSDFEVNAGDFIMKKMAGEPRPLFGNDLLSRYQDRRIHMTGAVSLLYDGKKYDVPAGLYFVYPHDTNLKDVNMLQYDYWLTDLANRITMMTNSSRSQSLTNRLRDRGETPVVTAIQPRPLSVKENGDSGFIPRPTKRRIN